MTRFHEVYLDSRSFSYSRLGKNPDIRPEISEYFAWNKVQKLSAYLNIPLLVLPTLITLANLGFAYYLDYPFWELVKNLLLFPISVIVMGVLSIPLMNPRIDDHYDSRMSLLYQWFEKFQAIPLPEQDFTIEHKEVFRRLLVSIFTDQEKSERFLYVVKMFDSPADSLCQAFHREAEALIKQEHETRLSAEKLVAIDLFRKLEERDSEQYQESEYLKFLNGLDTVQSVKKQQEWLKQLYLRKLSGDDVLMEMENFKQLG